MSYSEGPPYSKRGPVKKAIDRFMWGLTLTIVIVGGIATYFIMTTGKLPFMK